MKLWESDSEDTRDDVERFTTDKDLEFDEKLQNYDLLGSIAHVKMLGEMEILSADEVKALVSKLRELLEREIELEPEDEDIHTKIESILTEELREVGKKIHMLRSRNDQVLATRRLYSKDELLNIASSTQGLCEALLKFSRDNKSIKMPGYTHQRKALPSTVGIWSSSFVYSLLDTLSYMEKIYELVDQSPLGAGPGYPLPSKPDRKSTAEKLGFEEVQPNPLYTVTSRGKFGATVLSGLSLIMLDLSRLSNDLITFSMEEFGLFELPDDFCTGSSIMPQKKNPDPLELIRARSEKVLSNHQLLLNTGNKLLSGYARDHQEMKGPLVESFDIVGPSLEIFRSMVPEIKVNEERLSESLTPEIFQTYKAYELVEEGNSFRDAYRKIKEGSDEEKVEIEIEPPDLEKIDDRLQKSRNFWKGKKETFESALQELSQ